MRKIFKNKKAFTLIELLAVIVILGVIMVIAVPAVTKYIDKSRKDGFTKTASGVVDAARLYYSNEYSNSSESILEFECTTKECKNADGEKLELTKSPDKGTVKIFNDGEIIACFQRDTWYAVKNINDNEVTFGEGKCEYNEESNSYDTIALVSKEMVDELQEQLDAKDAELTALKSKGNATKEEILESKKAVVKGTEITGTMPNKGALSQSLTAGASLTLAPGYYSGGTITSNTLESQTAGTATAAQIESGYTAWVNGDKVTGTYVPKDVSTGYKLLAAIGTPGYTGVTTSYTVTEANRSSLVASDFLVLSNGYTQYQDAAHAGMYGGVNMSISGYNASTGVLTFIYGCYGTNGQYGKLNNAYIFVKIK